MDWLRRWFAAAQEDEVVDGSRNEVERLNPEEEDEEDAERKYNLRTRVRRSVRVSGKLRHGDSTFWVVTRTVK